MIIRKEIDVSKPLTEEQKTMLEEMESQDACPDESCPEITKEQLRKFVRASELKHETRALS